MVCDSVAPVSADHSRDIDIKVSPARTRRVEVGGPEAAGIDVEAPDVAKVSPEEAGVDMPEDVEMDSPGADSSAPVMPLSPEVERVVTVGGGASTGLATGAAEAGSAAAKEKLYSRKRLPRPQSATTTKRMFSELTGAVLRTRSSGAPSAELASSTVALASSGSGNWQAAAA